MWDNNGRLICFVFLLFGWARLRSFVHLFVITGRKFEK
uniref:Uncharacterized protein n=1 Tax=Rhizophora mucronata TaxID=61149 RepID=A0A2P2K5T3_RHIMU